MDPNDIIGIHAGETGLAIGNGPSLNEVPKKLLQKFPTFGVNYIYLLPFQPKYYVCIDTPILTNHSDKIFNVASQSEISFISSYHFTDQIADLQRLYSLQNVILIGRTTYSLPGEQFMSGWTSVYVALKVAFQMGFARMLLVGVDHSQDWDHFSDDYPLGNRMDERRFVGQRKHFQIAQDTYSADGREIINLSPPSKLDSIFPRGDYGDWL